MKELKYLNILYINNSTESKFLTYLESKAQSVFKIEAIDEIDSLLNEKSFDVLICEKQMEVSQLQKIRKQSKTVQIIIFEDDLNDILYLNAIRLEGIKYLSSQIDSLEFKDKLKDIIQILDSNSSNIIQLRENFIYDKYNNTLLKNRQLISLSKKEDMFLEYIISNQNRAISYEELNDNLWEGDMTHNALRSVVKEVRKKTYKDLVKNISGVGYRVDI